jgi:hypothetical protein
MGLLGNGDWIKFGADAPANLVDSAGFLAELTHRQRPSTYRIYFAERDQDSDVRAVHNLTFLPLPHPEEIERYVCEAWRKWNGEWRRIIPGPE